MAAAGANILTCNLSYTVSSAARSGKPIFFILARTGPLPSDVASNLKAAKTLGITVPYSLLAHADEVIE